jgi:hypothetical protein
LLETANAEDIMFVQRFNRAGGNHVDINGVTDGIAS